MIKKYLFPLFVTLLLANLALRLLAITGYNFAFTWDQARDLIDLRRLVFGHHPLLVGPTTGLTGVFLGPFWYYLNSIGFWISGGNPASLIITEITAFLLSGIFIYRYLRKFPPFNFIFSLLFLFSPLYFHTTHYSLNPNLLPIFFLLIFLFLPGFNQKTKLVRFIFFGVFVGLGLQVEAAMAIIFIPFVLGFFFFNHLKKINRLFERQPYQ